jgi:hypothetical protein
MAQRSGRDRGLLTTVTVDPHLNDESAAVVVLGDDGAWTVHVRGVHDPARMRAVGERLVEVAFDLTSGPVDCYATPR